MDTGKNFYEEMMMKKRTIFIAVSVFMCALGLSAEDAVVTAVRGKAEIKQNGGWVAAVPGTVIAAGGTVMTGFKSELTLKIGASVIVVQPLTRLKIEEILQKNETLESNVYLDLGAVKTDVKPPAPSKKVEFKVKTPVATASVRGTSGTITADGILIGTSGKWAFSNADGKTTLVTPGDIVAITDLGIIIPSQNTVTAASKENDILTLAELEKNVQTLNPAKNIKQAAPVEKKIKINVSWD